MNVVIIGNSAAGLNALESFRKYDKRSPVTVISKESQLAYSRVLLPHYLSGKLSLEKLYIRGHDFDKTMNANFVESRVISVDDTDKTVTLENQTRLDFDRLLIATGSSAILPPVKGLNGPGVYKLWTMADAKQIKPHFQPNKKVLVLGSGFVSLKIASIAIEKGLDVTVYELKPRLMPGMLDDKAVEMVEAKMLGRGVKVETGVLTESIDRKDDGTFVVHAKNRNPLEVDFIIAGTGIRPNIEFLENSQIETHLGIPVNDRMETNIPGIYAAGDVAEGPTAFDEKHKIHALWPTAVEMGKIAGANLAGENVAYQGSLNLNVSELFGLNTATIGQFIEENGQQVCVYEGEGAGNYIKVVFENDIPIGGIVAGESNLVTYLGKIRHLIRSKKPVLCSKDKLFQQTQMLIGEFCKGIRKPRC